MNLTMEEIVRRLKLAIYLSGKTDHEVALAARMNDDEMAKLLAGERSVSSLTLALICEATNTPVEAIVPTDLLRLVLEALCEQQGISLESEWVGPARNFELIERLGIGHVLYRKEGS